MEVRAFRLSLKRLLQGAILQKDWVPFCTIPSESPEYVYIYARRKNKRDA